jgi:hypothetical protein
MVPVPLSRLQPSRDEAIEDWPWLDQDVLRSSRSRQVCMTCHFFRHHPGPNCIPLLTCHLHQGLIAHGEHLTHRCSGWTEDSCSSGASSSVGRRPSSSGLRRRNRAGKAQSLNGIRPSFQQLVEIKQGEESLTADAIQGADK